MRGSTKVKLLAGGAVLGWLASIGALDPRLWAETIRRERERLPGQLSEAISAGKREAVRAEEALDREVQDAFRSARS
jgi:hypothetical protein